MTETTPAPKTQRPPPCKCQVPICADHDKDCKEVKNVLLCYLYHPERGFCPLLTGGKN